MKKVVLTVAALLVSAAMVFSFAGCNKDEGKEGTSGEATSAGAEA